MYSDPVNNNTSSHPTFSFLCAYRILRTSHLLCPLAYRAALLEDMDLLHPVTTGVSEGPSSFPLCGAYLETWFGNFEHHPEKGED